MLVVLTLKMLAGLLVKVVKEEKTSNESGLHFSKISKIGWFFLCFAEASPPLNVELSISHSVYIKGSQTNFEIEPSFGVEASELYPEVKYTTVDEYLDQFV